MAVLKNNVVRRFLVALLALLPAVGIGAPAPAAAAARATTDEMVVHVLVAIDMVDSTGFHGIAGDLADATEISPRLAGTMGKVLTVTRAAAWPAQLSAEVSQFSDDLVTLKDALEADDLEQARSASEAIHGSQHDLSNAAYAWLTGRYGGTSAGAVAMPSTMAAIDIIGSAGFHGIASDLAGATEISPRLSGTMNKVLVATIAAVWPAAVSSEFNQFIDDLAALKDALEADDLGQARSASEAVHGSQHDLSTATYAWLAGVQHGTHGSAALDLACTLAAIDMVDSAGFHGIAGDLADATEISPRLAGTMGNMLAVARAAAWPAQLSAEVSRFNDDLAALKDALEADDLEQARSASEAIHGSQHDLSSAAYAWIESTFATALAAPAAPSTGSAGLLAGHSTSPWLVVSLGVLTLAIIAAGRTATRRVCP